METPSYVVNPKTGRKVTIGSQLYKKLLAEGLTLVPYVKKPLAIKPVAHSKDYVYVVGKDIYIHRESAKYKSLVESSYTYHADKNALISITSVPATAKIELEPSVWSNLYSMVDILSLTLDHLDGKSLTNCSRVSKKLRRLVFLQSKRWVEKVYTEELLSACTKNVREWENTRDAASHGVALCIAYIKKPSSDIESCVEIFVHTNILLRKRITDDIPTCISTVLFPIVICSMYPRHLLDLALKCPKALSRYCSSNSMGIIHSALYDILMNIENANYDMKDIVTLCTVLQPHIASTTITNIEDYCDGYYDDTGIELSPDSIFYVEIGTYKALKLSYENVALKYLGTLEDSS